MGCATSALSEQSDKGNACSRCLGATKIACFRFFDENKSYIFFALLIFSVFLIFSRNTEIFLESLKFLESLNEVSQLLLFVVLFIFVSQPLSWGYIVLNVSAGFLYGFFKGVIVVCISSSIGISTVHFANRVCFKHCLAKIIKRLPDKVAPMMDLLKGKHAFKLVLLSRLTPLPFGLMNAFFAVSEVTSFNYILASVLGLLPTQAINSYIGTTLRSIEEITTSKHKSYYIILIFQIIACFAISSLVVRLANQNLDAQLLEVTVANGAQSNGTQSNSKHSRKHSDTSESEDEINNYSPNTELISHAKRNGNIPPRSASAISYKEEPV